jgi:LysR family glycine cleavage system transcriptional activator
MRNLERQMGETLLEKNGRGIRLTPIAHSYARLLDQPFAAIDETVATLRQAATSSSRISITLAPSLATMWLIPCLSQFEAQWPAISLRLATTARVLDIERDGLDIAIRYHARQCDRIERAMSVPEYAFPVCARAIARSPCEFWSYLWSGRIIGNDAHPDDWSRWQAQHLDPSTHIEPTMRMADSTMTLEAAAQGHGVAIGRLPIASRMLRQGRLVAPLGTTDRSGAHYVIEQTDSNTKAEVPEISRWLCETLRADCEC